MANGPEQGQPEAIQEVNLADETPSPRGYDLQLRRCPPETEIDHEGDAPDRPATS